MADIRTFRMVHYHEKFAKELHLLITPPYDVILPKDQDLFYANHPLNIIRLVLGKQFEDDSDDNNRYTRASSTLRKWFHDDVLVRADTPGFAIYQMDFQKPDGERRIIDGIVALVKVDDYGHKKVLPHEKTYRGPKEDQLRLVRACKAHLTPIHALYDDANDIVVSLYNKFMVPSPLHETVDADGTVHRVWPLQDARILNQIIDVIRDKSLFIADGHHRYETSRAYMEEIETSGITFPGDEHKYVMMYLTAMSHPGLTILPAHRMIKGLANIDAHRMLNALEPYFQMEDLCASNGNLGEAALMMVHRLHEDEELGGTFGVAFHGEACLRMLKLRDFKAVQSLVDPEIPSSLRELDVTILRELILRHGLGFDKNTSEGRLEYTPSAVEALRKALDGEVQVSFILNPTRVDQMRAAAELGHKLPHKSTYFFPKLSSGLVLNVFGGQS